MTHPYLVGFRTPELHDELVRCTEKFVLAVVNTEPNRALAAHHQLDLVRAELDRRVGVVARESEPLEAAVRRVLALTL